jgi:hypothetical protein
VPHLPKSTVQATLAQPGQIPAALAWARRHGLELSYDDDLLLVRLRLEGPAPTADSQAERYLITGEMDDFDVLPVLWRYVDPRTGAVVGPAAYPRPSGSSVLHGNGLICAPWSRLAYRSEGGVHADWGALTDWKTPRPPYTHALTIADMLDRLYRETRRSVGRMATLPTAE